MRAFVAIAAVSLCSGCFVSDELDKGMDLMDRHAREDRRSENKPAPAEKEPGPKGPSGLDELWGWATKVSEPTRRPPDPRDAPIRCFVGKRELFSTRSDCESRGGRAVELPPR